MLFRMVGSLDGVGVAIDILLDFTTSRFYIVHGHTSMGECWEAEAPEYPYEPTYRELVGKRAGA
jgi:hypothetical protein